MNKADNNEQKAVKLIAEAERILNSGDSSKVDEAIECYQRAAYLFKMTNTWPSAGQAFREAAALHLKVAGRRDDAATNYIDAGKCYRKSKPNEAVSCLLKAIMIYTDMGRFSIAAKHHLTIAEIYESELADFNKAMVHYEQAANYFKGSEDGNSSANKCMLKIAQYAAHLENYHKAIKIYEQEALASLDDPLLKESIEDNFFRAALCHFCIHVVNAQHAIQQYEQMLPGFQESRESKLVKTLIGHVVEHDVEGFTEAVKEYDSILHLDRWYTIILQRIQNKMAESLSLC